MMENQCQKIREKMLQLVANECPDLDAVEIQDHVKACPACSDYLEGLKADDRALTEFAESMKTSVSRIEQQALEQISGAGRSQTSPWDAAVKLKIAYPALRIAVAAVILLSLVLGTVLVVVFSGDEPVIVEEDPGTGQTPVLQQDDITQQADDALAREMEDIRRMVAAGDIDGLVDMLNSGLWESKLVAADHLARIGDERAIESLQRLASTWNGDPAENPFTLAIQAITERLSQETPTADANDTAQPQDTSFATMTTAADVTEAFCAGIVVNESYESVSGAKVVLYYNHSKWGLGNRIIAEALSDENGRFAFTEPLEFEREISHSYAQDSYILLALHEDYALGWQSVTQDDENHSYEIVLTEPTARSITVTDHNDNPLSGVRVWLYGAGSKKSSNPHLRNSLYLPTDVGLVGAITDDSGVATMTNVPKTGGSFNATLDGYATGLAFSGQQRIRLSRGANVSGHILAANDKPVPGATIKLQTDWMWNFFRAVTDEQGRFSLQDLPAKGWDMSPWGNSEGANGRYTLTIEHDLYASGESQMTLLPGQSKDDLVIRCVESTLIKCYVVYADTNEPVAGARIGGSSQTGRLNGYTDSNGIFTANVLPGTVSLFFHSPPDGVYVERSGGPESTANFTAAGREMQVILKAPPIEGRLTSVHGVVLGPNSRPRGNATVYADAGEFHTATAGSYVRPIGTNDDGQFELQEVPAGRKLYLYAQTKDHSLAGTAAFDVPPEPDESFGTELTLEATQSASVVIRDADGVPLVNMPLTVSPMVGGRRFWPAERSRRTDSEGRLEIDGVLPGVEYYLRDARFDKDPHKLPEGFDEWFTQTVVLIPADQP